MALFSTLLPGATWDRKYAEYIPIDKVVQSKGCIGTRSEGLPDVVGITARRLRLPEL